MMSLDPALNLVVAQLQQCCDPVLVIADEQLAALPKPPGGKRLQYISNRADVAFTLRQHGARVELNDFDFSGYACGQFDRIVYRISKEKAVVHHIINNAARILASGGRLTLIGHKNEGLNSYCKNTAALFDCQVERVRDAKGYSTATFTRQSNLGQNLNDSDYSCIRATVLAGTGQQFYSKPGIYGWQKIDRGSELLVDAIKDDIKDQAIAPAPSVLDLGCGYGYLSVMIGQLTGAAVVATDNNIAAISACEKNFSAHGIGGEVIADDCGKSIGQTFDLVVCNPPFHQGFDTSRALTEKFLREAARHLKSGGIAYFVVNRFIDIEAGARRAFSKVVEIKSEQGFKVLRLQS